MEWKKIFTDKSLHSKAVAYFAEQRSLKRLDGWFLIKEIQMQYEPALKDMHPEVKSATLLDKTIELLPLSISENAVFAGTQNDAFAKSYALINPTFRVETFEGYCDPLAVFNDIEPNEEFTKERIAAVRGYISTTPYVQRLRKVYKEYKTDMHEIAYFVEQVTGHLVPDFRTVIKSGINALIKDIDEKLKHCNDEEKINCYKAFRISLLAIVKLANRYADLAAKLAENATPERKAELKLMESALQHAPENGASDLYGAIQLYILLWQVMCIEQAPNPFAFSAGNVDRIFEPYRKKDNAERSVTGALLEHLLAFFNVGDRSWAISQNLMVGGKSLTGEDITNETSYALLDAYYACNFPQPILSIKLHDKTPDKLYEEMGRFFFTPGMLTPSLFNDDSLFNVLNKAGIEKHHLPDYSIAGCQEPLIMGQDNGNTTNSWLNLAKILELTLNNGKSLITGNKIGLSYSELGLPASDYKYLLENIVPAFYKQLTHFIKQMEKAANGCSSALSELKTPFLSCFMGGIESGADLRDDKRQGTRYNGSGCLIHGLSVVADSFAAIDDLLKLRPDDAEKLINALKDNFVNDEDMRQFLQSSEKYGNNSKRVDEIAVDIAAIVSDMVSSMKNYLGNSFRPDWSSPSTHLLYGYWVGATPDGRKAREMLGYGIDPLYGEANLGMGFRILSTKKIPFNKMKGGYASHFGIDPKYFPELKYEEKGMAFKNRIITPLFFSNGHEANPFYLYVNVTTPEMLRKVLADPKKYAPSGIYIMRIHGTFVNFLDLAPAIQEDIIKRLDLQSTMLN